MLKTLKLALVSLVLLGAIPNLGALLPHEQADFIQSPPLLWHKTYLTGESTTLSHDGQWVATPEGLNQIAVFNLYDGQRVLTLKGHTAPVRTVAFAPDRRLLASGSEDKSIRLWRIPEGSEVYRIDTNDRVQFMTFSPQGRILASIPGGAPTVLLWDTQTGRLLHVFQDVPLSVFSQLAFSSDGNFLACTTLGGDIEIWNVVSSLRSHVLRGHSDTSTAVAFSPDDTLLASASFDETIRLWNWRANQEIRIVESGLSRALAFSPDGQLLASGGSAKDNAIKIWNVKNGSLVRTLQGHQGGVRSVTFSPDGQYLISSGMDRTVKVWRVADGSHVRTFQGEAFPTYAMAYLSNPKLVAFSGDSAGIQLVQEANGSLSKVLAQDHHGITELTFSSDGAWLAFTQRFTLQGDTITLWNAADDEFKGVLRGHDGLVLAITFSADGEWLASGGTDGVVNLWRRQDQRLVWSIKRHVSPVLDVVFSPRADMLASASATEIKIWRVTDGQEIESFEGSNFVAFSPDGMLLATGGSNPFLVHVWRIVDKALVRVLSSHRNIVEMGIFSPDGTWLATGSSGGENTIKVWRIADGSLLWSWRADQRFLTSLAFSHDGRILFSGGGEGIGAWKLR